MIFFQPQRQLNSAKQKKGLWKLLQIFVKKVLL